MSNTEVQQTTIPSVEHADEGDVFEVFQQDQKDPYPHHGGNLRAPDGELAIHYAKEYYGRRQESTKLWIIPRASIWEVHETGQLQPLLHMLEHRPVHEATEEANQTFATFVQKQAGKPLIWLQDLEAPSIQDAATAATQLSEESYIRLWLCLRSAILELTNPDLLQPPLDRSYRRLDGYNIREKLRAARQRVQAQGEKRS
jgi:1,2-phenylacetyl-CoA epoxidase PaaB subunit